MDNNDYVEDNVDYESYLIYKDISDVPSKFSELLNHRFIERLKTFNLDKSKFDSNKQYNLIFWNEEILSEVYELELESDMGINELIKPRTEIKPLPIFSKQELIELREYVDNKISYIKNNL